MFFRTTGLDYTYISQLVRLNFEAFVHSFLSPVLPLQASHTYSLVGLSVKANFKASTYTFGGPDYFLVGS